jgi:hypothetical protein
MRQESLHVSAGAIPRHQPMNGEGVPLIPGPELEA